jgi:Spy/CpxP family protein refolding chaperone
VKTRLPIGLLAVALVAAPLSAQQHQHSDTLPGAGKQQMGTADCTMMGSMMSMMEQGSMMPMMGKGGGMEMKMGQGGATEMTMGQGGAMEMKMGQGGAMEMMTTMRYAPPYVLKNKGLLKLSPDQVSRIETIGGGGMGKRGMDAMGTSDNSMMKQMQAGMAQLKTAFDGAPADSAAIAAAVMPMAAMHGSMMAQNLVTAARVRDVLTPAQQQQLGKMPSPCMNGDAGMAMKRKTPAPRH